ncbi:FAD/NAD(P)-binding domain-containing protein [Meira miltonrushii]|uniref:FAD/NAD(P)-binding domain-containing protein n=1 Tax=Meira miltonrushii TaxID=1280837 RepID=A0A316VBN2_9BASI|nr:FAD/NAD(P)-binding domain-containing protein [Meira miltonrushii]PWN34714.1 FAD/NAD(P)-binding domain-containing protein [Meira miltonrushii]
MTPKAAVIGAGPVGCLTALGLQQRGYEVPNGTANGQSSVASSSKHPLSRSINLAISVRGLTALEFVDPSIAQMVLDNSVPMYGRMIHHKPSQDSRPHEKNFGDTNVKQESQAYSTRGDAINSVSRLLLSRLLLDETVNQGIEIRWAHRLQDVQFSYKGTEKSLLRFEVDKERQVEEVVDMIVGCDGHHSRIRKAIQTETEMNVTETSIDNLYSELHIPAKDELPPLLRHRDAVEGTSHKLVNGKYAIDPNHLHIWPRHDFMLIALANKDGSFTSTIFAPQRIYDNYLREPQSTIDFFANQFPDALQLIGEEALVQQICDRKPSPLGMVRCQSYHAHGQAIILGDSAHAMVPFYGQGLNCGLEDVRIFLEMLDEQSRSDKLTHSTQEKAFQQYSQSRHADLMAINDLALANFEEMSSNVVRKSYLLRKKLDTFLLHNLPEGWWSSLYMNVTFSNKGYHTVRQREAFQIKLLHAVMTSTVVVSLFGVGVLATRFWSWN